MALKDLDDSHRGIHTSPFGLGGRLKQSTFFVVVKATFYAWPRVIFTLLEPAGRNKCVRFLL